MTQPPFQVVLGGALDALPPQVRAHFTAGVGAWRYDGVMHEEALPSHPLRRYSGATYERELKLLLRPLLGV